MSRDDGFPVADLDSAYFDDAKLRALWRALADPDRMARAVCLHHATVLASWRQGCRVTVAEAAPLWLPLDDDVIGALRRVRLLDKAGRISEESWTRWFGPAQARREVRRAAGRRGGLTRSSDAQALLEHDSSNAEAMLEQTSSDAEPVRPSVNPSVPPVPSDGSTGLLGEKRARGLAPVQPMEETA